MTGTDGAADDVLGDSVASALRAMDRRAVARPLWGCE